MTTQTLAIDLIVADTEIQTRASLNTEHVADLRMAWDAKADIPPVIAYFDKTTYWLSEGFHRLQSAKEAKRGSLVVEVREGSKRDALHNALASNKTHGLRRSNEDKRIAVGKMLNDPEWSKWSDARIAEHIGVTQPFVSSIRKGVITVISPKSNGKPAPTTTKRVGRDGKIYKVSKPEPKTEPKVDKRTEFDTAKLDKELENDKKKQGRIAGFEEKRINDFVRKLVQLIDDQYAALTALCEEREAAMGGEARLYNAVKGKLKGGCAKAHDGINEALVAIDAWRGR